MKPQQLFGRGLRAVFVTSYSSIELTDEWFRQEPRRCERTRRFAVDHDHTTGVIRGLLCNYCNAGMGHFAEQIERLQQAIAYLERFHTGDRAA